MRTIVEIVDLEKGETLEKRLGLLTRESFRRQRDKTPKTAILSFLDSLLGLGYWWFPTFLYEWRSPEGSLYRKQHARRTLAGYTIPWGMIVDFYDHGVKSCEGEFWASAFFRRCNRRRHKYWLPDGTKVSQTEFMREMLGPKIDGCHDLSWER